ncbi:hypothetical protein ACQP00_22555 [Dactylosporangium sp. CS-047395]|uniref:hypothetical protein n=1 Tax=Dactylosporangium sp. CS-047395 TaxID=3239936 RepID=UPI003D93266D
MPIDDTLALAAAILGAPLDDPRDLGGSSRSRVLRGRTGDRTVIVKHFLADDGGHEREAIGLDLLDRTADLLARSDDGRLLVMSDLGPHPTLADLLLGADREAAWAGAHGWAFELGAMLARSRVHVAEARRRLPHGPAGEAPFPVLQRGLANLARVVPGLDLEAIGAEFAGAAALLEPGPADVLWPEDTCPDNAMLIDGRWWFLDLEGTDVAHPALAAAYMVLPFASCWCVFDPPPGLTEDLLAAFTDGLGTVGPNWQREVIDACAAYTMINTGWFADRAMDGVPHVGPVGRGPSYRQLQTARWRWGALNLRADYPVLSAALRDAAAWATDTWGLDAEPTGYPAFR